MYSTCRAHADPSDTLNEAQCLMMHFSFFRLRPFPVAGSRPPATVSSEVARHVLSRPAALAEPPLPPLTATRHWYTMDSTSIYNVHDSISVLYAYTSTVSTPEAVHDISASIQRASRSQTPRHAHPHSHSLPSRPHPPPSQIPRGKRKTKEQETTVYGASLAGSVTPERASGSVKPTHGDRKSTQAMKSRTGHARKQLSSSRASGVQQTPTDGHTAAIGTGSSTAKMKMKSKYASEVPARSEVTPSQITPTHSRLLDAMPRAHDILAAQVLYIVYAMYVTCTCTCRC